MRFLRYSAAALLMGALTPEMNAQVVLASFEDGMKPGTVFVDTWEQSPFNDGRCHNEPEVIGNPFQDDMNSSAKVLHYIRPYYAGDRNGVEIKLERPFNLTAKNQYIHVFVHKPVASRILLRGIDTENNVMQFEALSLSESRVSTWSDAVFAVKGSAHTIDRLVIYPDCASAVGRLNSDIDIYMDDIVISNSPEPRSVTDYCKVGGTVTQSRYLSSISTEGASLNLNVNFKELPAETYTKYTQQAIVAEAGAPFTLKLEQSSVTASNEPWAVDLYADFNADKEYVSEGEYLGRLEGKAADGKVVYTKEITVPAGTNISSCALRVMTYNLADAPQKPELASCGNVTDGMAVNIPMEISKYVDRPIISISGSDGQSGWGSIRFAEYDGSEIKVGSGTTVTVVATPNAGYEFEGWYSKETGGIVCESATFEFAAEFSIGLIAKFKEIPFCQPVGEDPVNVWFGQLKITPAGQNGLYYVGSEGEQIQDTPAAYSQYDIMGGVNVKRQSTFTLTGVKGTQSAALANCNLALWADWNNDHVFTADESVLIRKQVADTENMEVKVPGTALSGNVWLRLMMAEKGLTAEDACSEVGHGIVYDLQVTVAPGDDERFSLTAMPSVANGGVYKITPEAGEDGKFAAGTSVEITCVPADGYEFVQWMKDGIPYGNTMTSNNPLPLVLNEDLALTMKLAPKFPDYCEGAAPNNGDGDHYGVQSGYVNVNGIRAFNFTKGETAITDLSASCIADVCPGDTLTLSVTGGMHTQWAQGMAYIDWNMDGIWSAESDEAYVLFDNPGVEIKNKTTDIVVPATVGTGCFGIRLCSGEAPAHNNLGGGPCQARKRGTLFTFRVNSTALPGSKPKLNLTKGEGCTVTVTDNDGKTYANKSVLEAGASYNLTVTVEEAYMLNFVTVNDRNLEMTANGNVYTGSFVADETGAKILVAVNEKAYCISDETMRRTDRTPDKGNDNRYIESIELTGGKLEGEAQTISVSGLSRDPHRVIYEDHTEQVYHCSPGDVIVPKVGYFGSWMHKYVYVDWDKNYQFNVGSEGNWQDLVSFNYVNNKNSAGQSAQADGNAALGSFTVPEDANGSYRIRVKIDWDSLDPCGCFDESNSILDNGGGIVDFTLNVHGKEVGLDDTAARVDVYGEEGCIVVDGVAQGDARVYVTASGLLVKSVKVSGRTVIDMAQGIYIVRIVTDSFTKVAKVIVR